MKKNTSPYFSVAFTFIVMLFSCIKNKSEIERLPEATRQGRGTMGCLINGKAFTPKGSLFAGSIKRCEFYRVNDGHIFNLSAKNSDEPFRSIHIFVDSLSIREGMPVPLKAEGKGAGSAHVYISRRSQNTSVDKMYRTNVNAAGQLTVSKLDSASRIISGTFWYDAADKDGHLVSVREGRFDMKF